MRWATAGYWLCSLLAAGGLRAQEDTVPLVVLGGAMQDEGVEVAPREAGGAWILVRSNSMTMAANQGYCVRVDDALQVQEVRTVVQSPFWSPVSVVAHGDGGVSVLGLAYGGEAQGYDLGWQHWPAAGGSGTYVTHGSGAWELPVCMERVGEGVLTGFDDYSGGWAAPVVLRQSWTGTELVGGDTLRLEGVGYPRHLVALRSDGERVFAGGNEVPGSDGVERGALWAWNGDGSLAWMYQPPLPNSALVAMDWGPEGGIAVFAEELGNGEREMHFLRWDGDGEPGLWMNLPTAVPLEAKAVAWVGSDFAVLFETDAYGLGGKEWLYSRYDGAGVWQGGPTLGTAEQDVPVAMRAGADGAVWMVGHSDGFAAAGSRDAIAVRLADPAWGNYALDVLDATLEVPLSVTGNLAPAPHLRAVPNPSTGRFFIVSDSEAVGEWRVFDARGRLWQQGAGPDVDVTGCPAGVYFLLGQTRFNPFRIPILIQTP